MTTSTKTSPRGQILARAATLFVALFALVAFAGERYLGTIVSAAVDKTNATTATPFFVPPNAKITIQCDAISYVLTDTSTAVSSTNGVKLAADFIFPTSTTTSPTAALGDGGTPWTDGGIRGAVVRAIASTGTANCKVWQRLGTE